MMRRPRPLRPERVRIIERPFGWVPFRLLTSGLLARLDPPAKLLYFFLCLVADRDGVSFYGDRRILDILRLSPAELAGARADLVEQDLLATDGQVCQVLSLPPYLPVGTRRSSVRRGAPGSRRRGGSDLEPIGHIVGKLLWEE